MSKAIGDYMYNFIVCDDNKIVLNNVVKIIKEVCSKCDIKESITLFSDYNLDFMDYVSNNKEVSIYILDIETPSNSGIEMAKMIRKKDYSSIIIFLTSHDELAYEIIRDRLNIFTFVSKLVNYKSYLADAINECIYYVTPDKYIHFKDLNKSYSINVSSILYITKVGRKTSIITDNSNYEVYISLSRISELLPNYFIKSHRACIVNSKRIEEIKNKSITFDNGIIIDLVSSKYKKDLCI